MTSVRKSTYAIVIASEYPALSWGLTPTPTRTSTAAPVVRNDCAWHEQGKLEEADPLSLRAIEILERSLGPDNPDLAVCLKGRAGLLLIQVVQSCPRYILRVI